MERTIETYCAMVAITLAAALGYELVDWSCLKPSDRAAWVQAIGAIGAIAGAAWVGRRQSETSMRQALHLRELERLARADSIKAVVESAVAQAKSVSESVQMMPNPVLRMSWSFMLKDSTDAVIASLDALPLHELSSAQKVIAVTSIRSSLARLRFGIQQALDGADPLHASAGNPAMPINANGLPPAGLFEAFWQNFLKG